MFLLGIKKVSVFGSANLECLGTISSSEDYRDKEKLCGSQNRMSSGEEKRRNFNLPAQAIVVTLLMARFDV